MAVTNKQIDKPFKDETEFRHRGLVIKTTRETAAEMEATQMKLAESRTTKRYKYKRRNPNKNQCTTRK
jgi:hypothetical protein